MKPGVFRKLSIGALLAWTLIWTVLRAVRLPNEFSKAHWLIDYRFGFVKRGVVGTAMSLITSALRVRPSEALIAGFSIALFAVFCVVLLAVGLRILYRSEWSPAMVPVVLAFLSSPFVVMSAHLIGYFDNIVIVLAVASLALLFKGRIVTAAIVQAVSILVHENGLLIGLPAFCFTWFLLLRRGNDCGGRRLTFWPLLLPIAAAVLLAISPGLAPAGLEDKLTAHLATFPFVGNAREVRVPHWITITFGESYELHQGLVSRRLLSEPMIGLVLSSIAALLSVVVDGYRVKYLSAEWLALLAVCFVPQTMHIVAYDTTRIWTYSILEAFLLVWIYVEALGPGRETSDFGKLLCLIALVLNALNVTPLMDGLREHFELSTRVWIYTPVLAATLYLSTARGYRYPS